eukprot:TRINITY_DN1244_c0_g2_i1.p1 TRINITY_DN1244_c0_g2~~TRINITY_DN1244_c0_g2_i1.p1  ORF type:complete len:106 (-),score=12.73 TRINITY_DN1244_c0_g2_i1:256-573(-)
MLTISGTGRSYVRGHGDPMLWRHVADEVRRNPGASNVTIASGIRDGRNKLVLRKQGYDVQSIHTPINEPLNKLGWETLPITPFSYMICHPAWTCTKMFFERESLR